ncbi:MAG: L,D-transpeptidase family protein [Zoogloeaceae bacterium]|jgi:murein L,D-transpeptidase YafK|nr:L,D-transpeptidase family protein [Zoogloeaceae bacterium]
MRRRFSEFFHCRTPHAFRRRAFVFTLLFSLAAIAGLRMRMADGVSPDGALTALSSANAAHLPEAAVLEEPSSDLETQLARIFAAIGRNQLPLALNQTEHLLQRYPNYRLAYLIKGDLLLSRGRALSGFGVGAQGQAAEQIDGLRMEALARLRGYQEKPPADAVPRDLLRMSERQKYALLIDTGKSRLYLYENAPDRPRFVRDYYVSQGKLGADKMAEGDRRTPLGVYRVTSFIPPEKLADMYGHGAYPLDYPNEWDKLQERGGSGIWLHGTPSDTYSRPPLASDGCVVLSNPDFDALGRYVEIGETPVIISRAVEWLSLADWQRERAEVSDALEAWRLAWESRDTERYLAFYAPDFRNRGNQDFARFAAQKSAVNRQKSWITVQLRQLSIFRLPTPPVLSASASAAAAPAASEVVVATFEQDYASNNLASVSRKRQYWRRDGGQWKIVYESGG